MTESEEQWKSKKRTRKYPDTEQATKLLKSLTKTKKRLPHSLLQKELTYNEVQKIHSSLQSSFPNIDGLSEPGLALCVTGRPLTRFWQLAGRSCKF